VITTNSLGAVRVGMSLAQAQEASGEVLATHGDGQYTGSAPGLEYQAGYGSEACLVASPPSPVRTENGLTFGDSLERLRSAYGTALKYYSAAGGMNDPNSYYIHDRNGYLFFHLTADSSGTVTHMAAGASLAAACC
jgi:hypothetical protein